MERAVRAHGNCVEYLPLSLFLLLVLAMTGLAPLWLHVLGIALTVGRLLHGVAFSLYEGRSFGRAAGVTLNWLMMLAAIVLCLIRGIAAL